MKVVEESRSLGLQIGFREGENGQLPGENRQLPVTFPMRCKNRPNSKSLGHLGDVAHVLQVRVVLCVTGVHVAHECPTCATSAQRDSALTSKYSNSKSFSPEGDEADEVSKAPLFFISCKLPWRRGRGFEEGAQICAGGGGSICGSIRRLQPHPLPPFCCCIRRLLCLRYSRNALRFPLPFPHQISLSRGVFQVENIEVQRACSRGGLSRS